MPGFALSPAGSPITIELFLDLICPFSCRMYKTVYEGVLPKFGAQVCFGEARRPETPDDTSRALGERFRCLGIELLGTALDHGRAQACLEHARALGDNDALSQLDELAALKQDFEGAAKALLSVDKDVLEVAMAFHNSKEKA